MLSLGNIESLNSKVNPDMCRMLESLEQLKNPSFLHSAFLDPLFRKNFSAMTEACESIHENMMRIIADTEYTASEEHSRVIILQGESSSVSPVELELNHPSPDTRFNSRQIDEEKTQLERSRIDRDFGERKADNENSNAYHDVNMLPVVDVGEDSSQVSGNYMDIVKQQGDYHDMMRHNNFVGCNSNSDRDDDCDDSGLIITITKKPQLMPLESGISDDFVGIMPHNESNIDEQY